MLKLINVNKKIYHVLNNVAGRMMTLTAEKLYMNTFFNVLLSLRANYSLFRYKSRTNIFSSLCHIYLKFVFYVVTIYRCYQSKMKTRRDKH